MGLWFYKKKLKKKVWSFFIFIFTDSHFFGFRQIAGAGKTGFGVTWRFSDGEATLDTFPLNEIEPKSRGGQQFCQGGMAARNRAMRYCARY